MWVTRVNRWRPLSFIIIINMVMIKIMWIYRMEWICNGNDNGDSDADINDYFIENHHNYCSIAHSRTCADMSLPPLWLRPHPPFFSPSNTPPSSLQILSFLPKRISMSGRTRFFAFLHWFLFTASRPDMVNTHIVQLAGNKIIEILPPSRKIETHCCPRKFVSV